MQNVGVDTVAEPKVVHEPLVWVIVRPGHFCAANCVTKPTVPFASDQHAATIPPVYAKPNTI